MCHFGVAHISTKRPLRSSLLMLMALACLNGCVAYQLKGQTANLGETVETITAAQIVSNLHSVAVNPYAIPSQFVLGAGSASISNQFTPSTPGSGPISFSGKFITGLSLQDQNQIALGWGLAPVTDFSDLRRLSALYQYALGEIDITQFELEYARAYAPVSSATVEVRPMRDKCGHAAIAADVTSTSQVHLYLPLPSFNKGGGLRKSPNDGLDFDEPLPPSGFILKSCDASKDDVIEGDGGPGAFCMAKEHSQEYWHDFVLWVLGATPNTAQTATGGGGGGSKSKSGEAGEVSPPRAPPQQIQ